MAADASKSGELRLAAYHVVYSYMIDGEEYTAVGKSFIQQDDAESRMAEGKKYVAYLPNDPVDVRVVEVSELP